LRARLVTGKAARLFLFIQQQGHTMTTAQLRTFDSRYIEERLDELQALRIQAYGTSGGIGATRPWVCPAEYLPTPGYKADRTAQREFGELLLTNRANGFDLVR